MNKKTSRALCTILSMLSIMFFTAICVGQTETEPAEYETPGVLKAHEILPPNLLEGRNYNVHEDVLTYGFTNFYTIMSPFGTFAAHGDDMVRTRIHEIKAIAALQEVKRSKAFGEAAKKAATSSVKGAWGLISRPVKTVSGVPRGIGKLFSRVGEMVKGERGDSEDSVVKELIGFSAVKRDLLQQKGPCSPALENAKLSRGRFRYHQVHGRSDNKNSHSR
jgi:hypothetical protein